MPLAVTPTVSDLLCFDLYTTSRAVTGFYRPSAGTISIGGRSTVGLAPSRIASMGVARTFQNLRLFPRLSVLDNVRAGLHTSTRQSVWDALLHTPRFRCGVWPSPSASRR